eukprot:CAMPEP_0203955370 /NCGR_PEP_ID=MMETSP0359-20131031/88027_1 /ASSEMBLY_ACC=CAM_ASM_000338 /TAXON_ID=268821 /ORGANISM="Scrippsiella Hangoei, Strain SHTV-5" /LENGTH=121 /DNA_ID=CAMNT_0050888977 /DNA_START=159 /DNA_END=524 /DNA_ORIENTATION=+
MSWLLYVERSERQAGNTHDVEHFDIETSLSMSCMMLWGSMAVAVDGFRSAPRPRNNSFMAAEPWLPSVADMWLEIGYLKTKLEIYTLGRRRARNGLARCRDEMVKCIENCRSGGGARLEGA